MFGYSRNGPRGPPYCARAATAVSRIRLPAASTRVRTVRLLLRRGFLGERGVVLLDRLAESFRHLIGAGQRQRVVAVVGLAAQRELELLQLFDRRRLQLLEPFRVRVDAIVVEGAQILEHLVEIARVHAGLLQLTAEAFGVGRPLAELTAELADV